MSALPQAATELTDAAGRGDKLAAWHATGRLLSWLSDLSHPVNAQAAFQLVWTGAAGQRWFDIAELLAGALAGRADAPASLRRLHAQMLMERGYDAEALARLLPLRGESTLGEKDRGEVLGHIGRIYKDRFIAAARTGDEPRARSCLERALNAYRDSYLELPQRVWHGINAVALLARPEARSGNRKALQEAQALARQLIAQVTATDPSFADRYSRATIAEAHLALGDYAAALDWVRRHVANPAVNAFALGSPLRQFEEVWELGRRPSPGPEILDLLRAALLEEASDDAAGVVHLGGEAIRRGLQAGAQLEAVFGADRFDSFENYRRGLERCACVARIGRSAETGVGTGFVVPGALLSPKLGEAYVLVTNAHVVSELEVLRQQGALHPSEAVVTFAALEGVESQQEFALSEVRFHSPPDRLDVTIAELRQPVTPQSPYPLAPVLPIVDASAQVRVIGHPSGRGLSLSANKLLDHEAPRVHYRTATEGGSSGSPIFTREWKLIGVHHAGGDAMPRLHGRDGTYQANEGIYIGSIRDALQAALA